MKRKILRVYRRFLIATATKCIKLLRRTRPDFLHRHCDEVLEAIKHIL